MEIRGDYSSVEAWLRRLLVYAETFRRFNTKDWSHLKNQEDYNRVYQLPIEQQKPLDSIYADGRDIAVHMSQKLPAFNYADQYPTLRDFVDSFNHGWIYQIDLLEKQVDEARAITSGLPSRIWAVDQMIDLYIKQLDLLRIISQCISFLRSSDLYRIESGYIAPNPSILAYEVILACINDVGKMFERLPKTYVGKDEEGFVTTCSSP